MKNATKHAEQLRSLFRKMLKGGKPEPMQRVDPLKALVRGAMSFDVSDSRADDAMRAIDREFVDLNELRVATDLEIQELLGERYPAIVKRVAMITQALNHIFEKEHTLSLARMTEISRRDAREFLRTLPAVHPFVEAYVMLFSFEGHTVPIDDEILAYLKDEGILEEDTSLEDAQKFVEHHIKADECHGFFASLRAAANKGKRKAKA